MNRRHASAFFPIDFTILLGFSLLLSGCVGATKLPTRFHGPEGANIEKRQLDLSFIATGTTTRGEVVERLKMIDTGYSDPHLFWGRWAGSNWGYWWMFLAMGYGVGAGGPAAAGDAKRVWKVQNLLVIFDDNGIVRSSKVTDNDSLVWSSLRDQITHAEPLDLSQPVPLSLTGGDPVEVLLSRESMLFQRRLTSRKPAQISPHHVVRLSHAGTEGKKQNHPDSTCHVLHVSQKTSMGKKISFCAKPKELVELMTYLQQFGPAEMKWE